MARNRLLKHNDQVDEVEVESALYLLVPTFPFHLLNFYRAMASTPVLEPTVFKLYVTGGFFHHNG